MPYLKMEQMPGPTPEAKAAQYRQLELLEAFYAAYNVNHDLTEPAVVEAREAYDESVKVLVEMLGPDAQCGQVDTELIQSYSDAYKGTYNFRPRGYITRPEVLEWFERLKTRQPVAE